METIASVKEPVTTTILDPWYNRGVGGVREDYIPWLQQVIGASFEISQHVFVWGFPEIVGHVLDPRLERRRLDGAGKHCVHADLR